MRVSIGVLPTNRTKNNCSMTEDETVRREGKRSNNFPNRVGWLGYWLRTYSSRAHWDFSCKLSTWATSDRPQASVRNGEIIKCLLHQLDTWTIHLQNDKPHYSNAYYFIELCYYVSTYTLYITIYSM